MKKLMYMNTEIGRIGIAEDGRGITDVFFCQDFDQKLPDMMEEATPLLESAIRQMNEYFKRKRKIFDLPLSWKGTDFQTDTWKALCKIPYGETRSYKEIAMEIGRPNAYRAVGLANHCNPIAIIIPCHRVVGANGTLVGYGGGLDKKHYLLLLERESGGKK